MRHARIIVIMWLVWYMAGCAMLRERRDSTIVAASALGRIICGDPAIRPELERLAPDPALFEALAPVAHERLRMALASLLQEHPEDAAHAADIMDALVRGCLDAVHPASTP